MRIEWKSNLHGVARCPAEYKVLGEGEPAGTFEAYVAIFGTPDRPDLFGDSDVIEPGAFTQTLQEKGLPPIVWSPVWTIPPRGWRARRRSSSLPFPGYTEHVEQWASAELEVTYSLPGDAWQVSVPVEAVADVLAPFGARKRAFLVRLLNGWSKKAAAAGAGVSVRTTQLWAKAELEFADAVHFCEEAGFASVVESELYRRAFAGAKDKGSMRALELVLKSRSPKYRDAKRDSIVTTVGSSGIGTDWIE